MSQLVEKFAQTQAEKNIGLPFDQVYDLDSIEPTREWQNLYESVCEELTEYGLDLMTV